MRLSNVAIVSLSAAASAGEEPHVPTVIVTGAAVSACTATAKGTVRGDRESIAVGHAVSNENDVLHAHSFRFLTLSLQLIRNLAGLFLFGNNYLTICLADMDLNVIKML